jgi:hypothetical protein
LFCIVSPGGTLFAENGRRTGILPGAREIPCPDIS